MSQFFDPDITAIAPDTDDLGNGTGKQQPVVRIQTKFTELTLTESDVQAVVDAMFAAKRLIP